MSNGDSEVSRHRRAFGELINIGRKRDLSSITGKFIGDGGLLKKGKTCDGNGKGLDFLTLATPGPADDIMKENSHPDVSNEENENRGSVGLLSSDTDAGIAKAENSRAGCFSFGTALSQSNISDDSFADSDDSQEDCEDGSYFIRRGFQMDNGNEIISSANGLDVGERGTGQSGSCNFEASGIEGILNPREALVGKKATIEDIMGPGKACSCSLCLKAAYMWTDLHYQDTRGRLAALKKSRRYARSLEGKFQQDLATKGAQDYPRKSAELEFDLMQRCRSLFLHTEDALVRETAQLHTNLLKLKEMREKCKRDLEKMAHNL